MSDPIQDLEARVAKLEAAISNRGIVQGDTNAIFGPTPQDGYSLNSWNAPAISGRHYNQLTVATYKGNDENGIFGVVTRVDSGHLTIGSDSLTGHNQWLMSGKSGDKWELFADLQLSALVLGQRRAHLSPTAKDGETGFYLKPLHKHTQGSLCAFYNRDPLNFAEQDKLMFDVRHDGLAYARAGFKGDGVFLQPSAVPSAKEIGDGGLWIGNVNGQLVSATSDGETVTLQK